MRNLRARFVTLLLIPCLSGLYAQEPEDGKQPGPEEERAEILARQSTVFEQFHTTVTFEKDGRWEQEEFCRARVESEGGVRQMGKLIFGYAGENQRLEILMARVLKKDGTVVEAGPESILQISEPLAGLGNEYTDYRQKHVLMPDLQPGDKVEYRVKTIEERPFAPGHFWFAHRFHRRQTCLDDRLVISVPDTRIVKLRHKPKHVPAIKDEEGRKRYEWHTLYIPEKEKKPSERKRERKSRKELEEEAQPDVQLTTFADWEKFGAWYRPLQESRMNPTDELRRQTEELTRNCKTDLDKVKTIYSFVATGVRYVSLSFGLGRFIPHPADRVLGNRYGDCKDKHTLLAAMLRIAGFQACPVLTNTYRDATEDQPSPIQFNHVLTLVHLGDSEIWLDTTSETAPFQVLSGQLRKKTAVVVHLHEPSELTKIPGTPPFPFSQETGVEATLSDTGTLTGRVNFRVRGDDEIVLRRILRARPSSDWKEVVGGLHGLLNLPGEVTAVLSVSDPLNPEEPVKIDYEFSGLLAVSGRAATQGVDIPLPDIHAPWGFVDAEERDPEPIDLGYPNRQAASLRLKLPSGFITRPPLPVSVKRDYGEYHSKYEIAGDILIAERQMEIRVPEIDGKRGAEHQSFSLAVSADASQTLKPEEAFVEKLLRAGEDDAEQLYARSASAHEKRDYSTALDLANRAVRLEPKHRGAWNQIGRCHLALGQPERAIPPFLKQIEINPYDEYAYNNLGRAYWGLGRYREAEEALLKQLEINPLDQWAHKNLVGVYYDSEQYDKALPEAEKALTITPEDNLLRLHLGSILFHLGRLDEGFQAFSKALESSQNPTTWNNVAYALAESRFRMDLAEQYAESAVQGVRTVLLNMPLSGKFCCPLLVDSLAAHWDTLGFVYLQKGDKEKAEKYIHAAWELAQHGECGLHLARIYLERGDKGQAIKQLSRSLAGHRPPKEVREKLAGLVGADKVESLKEKASKELLAMRTFKVSPGRSEDVSANFSLILASNLPQEVKFIDGDEQLREYEGHLKKVRFRFLTPDAEPVRLIRRGQLRCSAATGSCNLILDLPHDVYNLDPTPAADQAPEGKELSGTSPRNPAPEVSSPPSPGTR